MSGMPARRSACIAGAVSDPSIEIELAVMAQRLEGGEHLAEAGIQGVGVRAAEADDMPRVEDEQGAGAHALGLAEHAVPARDKPARLEVG
jgi:hypothetical protein